MTRRDAGVKQLRRSLLSYRHFPMKTFKHAFFAIVITTAIWGCSYQHVNRISEYKVPDSAFDPSRTPPAPDYADRASWAVLPGAEQESMVDVFFVHPTSYFGDESWNQSMPDEKNNPKTMEDIEKQASIFEGQGNIYAPFYRQASLHALDAAEEDKNRALSVGYADIESAFRHYLQNHNDGKPFILAGHSQGSSLLLWLLERVFDEQELMKPLVATYMIGWSVTENDIRVHPQLKVCDSFDETGCIVSYNTQEKNPEISLVREGAIAVNPLTWNTSSEPAPKELNLGAVFHIDGVLKEIPNYTGAQIVDGALIVPRPSNADELKTPKGFYHSYDYAFFYRNLEKNVADRIAAYLSSN